MASIKKGGSKLRKQVRRDVRAAYKPILAGFNDQSDFARKQMEADQARIQSIYGGLNSQLAGLAGQFGTAGQQILGASGNALAGVTSADPAVAKALGAIGGASISNLSAGLQGNLANAGAGLQTANLNAADLEANVLRRYREFVNDIKMQKNEFKGQRAQTFLQELQNRKEFRLAKKEQEIRAEIAKDQLDQDQEATQWVLNQAEKTELNQLVKKWRSNLGLPALDANIQTTKDRIATLEANKGQWTPSMTTEFEQLKNSLADLQAERQRKRSRVRKKRSVYKKKHGS